jgi:NAD(P)-dependent dehydrogenase (short-subunit alcohol dehydrogenase family)
VADWPRLLIVTSESHRNSKPLSTIRLDTPVQYGVKDTLTVYAYTKLMLAVWAHEFYRRLGGAECHVAAICPGPVDSDIARNAPQILLWLVKPVFKLFFRSPQAAAQPLVRVLLDAPPVPARDSRYFHMETEKPDRDDCRDEHVGRALWEESEALLRAHGR